MKFPGTGEIKVGGGLSSAEMPPVPDQFEPVKPGLFDWTKEARANAFGDIGDLDDFHQEGLNMFELRPAKAVRHPILKVASVCALVLLGAILAVGYLTGAVGNLEPLGPLIGAGAGTTTAATEEDAEPDYQGLLATTEGEANVYIEASTDSAVVDVLTAGMAAHVTGPTEDGWVPVAIGDVTGWVIEEQVTIAAAPPEAEAEPEPVEGYRTATTTNGTNFRTGPSTSYSVIMVIPRGVEVTVTGPVEGGWAPVTHDGHEGYIGAINLDIEGE